jgi:hypothetical protein
MKNIRSIRRYKNIIEKIESFMLAQGVETKRILGIVIKKIIVEISICKCRIPIPAIPDMHGRGQISNISVINAYTIPDRIIVPFARAIILIDAVSGAPIFIR